MAIVSLALKIISDEKLFDNLTINFRACSIIRAGMFIRENLIAFILLVL